MPLVPQKYYVLYFLRDGKLWNTQEFEEHELMLASVRDWFSGHEILPLVYFGGKVQFEINQKD